ncbi:MAG: rubrerythrin family protein [Eubacterium aggregans]|uniref:Rubrerythrin n=1 Tax=Eubacterium aggregans TaxID=81409 RepID=A0A1H4AKE4_9FIRM|nr:rubrerythrin family protein [Eubacterium aggregans]MDD4691565.1 rubrerythrin family protein [Eubacterium aggregans]MEA5073346.1 rubrerythrin family protein [Eubacterium aggregans]SEA36396.1 Rubrerythrin [Eubacterium aggregans]
MGRLKGTKTLENLMKAFAGESQARNRYTFFASKAKKEGYVQMQEIFLETAANEKEHGEMFYKYIVASEAEDGGCVEVNIDAGYPVALSDSTYDNLIHAAEGENEEWAKLYPAFAAIAKLEGFDDIASTFIHVCVAEMAHETRYRKLAENIKEGRVFTRVSPTKWKCGNCGYIHEGDSAPQLCPACKHPQDYFELFVEAY